MVGEQVLAREADSYGEALGAFADQHDMSGVRKDGLGDQRDVLDVAHGSDRASAARRSVHAAGVELDHSFFVGNSAEANAGVVGIVFRSLDHFERGVERVAAAFQEGECVLKIVEAVVGADDDGALVRSGLRRMVCSNGFRRGWFSIVALGARSNSRSHRSENGRLHEITAREGHEFSFSVEAGSISRAERLFHHPLYGLKRSSTTIAKHLNDLPITSPHGSDFDATRKLLKLHQFERSARHSDGTPRQVLRHPQRLSGYG